MTNLSGQSHPVYRASDKACITISIMPISSPNRIFDHLLESFHQDDSNKWSNIEFGEETMQAVIIEVNFMHLIWSSVFTSEILCTFECRNVSTVYMLSIL